MLYRVLSPLLSSMSDGGRNSHLSPHSTGKPQKTIVGCWRSLNFDPDSFGLYLGEKRYSWKTWNSVLFWLNWEQQGCTRGFSGTRWPLGEVELSSNWGIFLPKGGWSAQVSREAEDKQGRVGWGAGYWSWSINVGPAKCWSGDPKGTSAVIRKNREENKDQRCEDVLVVTHSRNLCLSPTLFQSLCPSHW